MGGVSVMEFKQWVTNELKQCTEDITSLKEKLKATKQQKKDFEKIIRVAEKANDSDSVADYELQVKHAESSINKKNISIEQLKDKKDNLQRLSKTKLIRLKAGSVISLSLLQELERKIDKKKLIVSYTQHPEGLRINYSGDGVNGSFKITGYGVDISIPDEVKLPIFEEGEVMTCSIRS